ncbi:unnamed protein product [Caenorhabditis angaria]|uniref:NR LBD domain-containing protein n=1 Tax=Caenorhabditis angaria TaxID=860376 RepID=A0A9P1ISS7_9PELO|nr:unnamed protein product [Caenorhabditis angaria]
MSNLLIGFDDLSSFPVDQQKILVKHFIGPFVFLEGGFKSINRNIWVLPSDDYVDCDQPEMFYKDSEDEDDSKGRKAYETFKPYWSLNRNILKVPMDETKLDKFEFLFLCALVFWDFGLSNQTEDSIAKCQKLKTSILEELSSYEKSNFRGDASYRVAQIVIILQAVQRSFDLLSETLEVSLLYDIFEHHSSLFDTIPK